jgi:hypothetical protein
MLTIFEGPDAVGKTEFARIWQDYYNSRIDGDLPPQKRQFYVHSNPHLGCARPARLFADIMALAYHNACDVVMDRCWISELIYSHVMHDRKCRISPAEEWILAWLAWKCGARIIYCTGNVKTCGERWLGRIENEYVTEWIVYQEIFRSYQQLFAYAPFMHPEFPYSHVNYSKMTYSNNLDFRSRLDFQHYCRARAAAKRRAPSPWSRAKPCVIVKDDWDYEYSGVYRFPLCSFKSALPNYFIDEEIQPYDVEMIFNTDVTFEESDRYFTLLPIHIPGVTIAKSELELAKLVKGYINETSNL